ncbi:lipid II:glycine glycyltransferase FemX [Paenibacillus sp. KN14-4R]|uniref:lipid II:glycine glycyltransferase FemX n=1 Tax=Paenibacillus sp. KN14-4R TaxID=3445773 RepID=UPI003F9FF2D4
MRTYTILGSEDRKIWDVMVQRIGQSDVYFTSDYLCISEANGEGKAQLFVYQENDEVIIYPYLLRDLHDLPHMKDYLSTPCYDITTPYGYGGPLCSATDEQVIHRMFRSFENVFHAYCLENFILTEFVRFHPLLHNASYYQAVEPTYIRNTIAIDLKQEEGRFSEHHRRAIRKATKFELEFAERPTSDLSQFLPLYTKTMDKRDALSYYYFSNEYFEKLARDLGDRMKLLEIKHQETVISSALFFIEGDIAQYHLQGSSREHETFFPSHYLIYRTMEYMRQSGCKWLHLGGGYAGNEDGLYRFKKGFDTKGELPFYIGKRIHNQEQYQSLLQQINPQELAYFPIYRHPTLFKKQEQLTT